MKIEFTPEGGDAITLGDDAAGLVVVVPPMPKVTALIEPNPLPRAATIDHIPRENLESGFPIVIAKNFYPPGTADTPAVALGKAALYAALQGAAVAGKKGSMTMTEGSASATLANATCQGVTPRLLEGVEVEMQYDFVGGVFEED